MLGMAHSSKRATHHLGTCLPLAGSIAKEETCSQGHLQSRAYMLWLRVRYY